MLELFMLPTYSFFKPKNPSRKFNLGDALDKPSTFGYNTPFHQCSIRDNAKCFDILLKMNSKIEAEKKMKRKNKSALVLDNNLFTINYRGWLPMQLASSKNKYFNNLKYEMRNQEIYDCIDTDKVNFFNCSTEKLIKYNSRYHYVIISVADNEDIKQSTIYKQLHKIQQQYRKHGLLEIACIESHKNRNLGYTTVDKIKDVRYSKKIKQNHFIYKLRVTTKLQQYLALVLGLKVYNVRHNF